MRLEGKVSLVTGAARGIGEAIAQAFADEGAIVYVTDIDQDNGRLVAQGIGSAATFALLDVRSEDAWRTTIEAVVHKHGRLDILVNNAGITGLEGASAFHDPENASLEAWRSVHETNLDGVFLGCKYAIRAIRAMRATGVGSIINISSRSGLVGIPAAVAYASSKAAVRNHTKSVALYCAQQGMKVRCNSIHPAAILTPMWEPMLGTGPDRESNMAMLVQDTPLKRFGTPQEVAAVAVMLAADESSYMTGAEISIDGGILAGSAGTPAPAT
ncbi:MAG: glucose 1-dehydrogenase [Azonexus sp.]|jgi:NAD(P)-dependent dehydrogenase (short-subunit alcohol dehydrogenase family)|uniref:glucose 1-dehydrogenase n=1 Tax=Azonexus sp. TaxID=1872668 RepID=UPI002817CD29|nr:glucose 1-dehydrogenase [Azonexus sp.]MDR0776558.1 glucose 1-dehydrogenase [Azonexus sp.]